MVTYTLVPALTLLSNDNPYFSQDMIINLSLIFFVPYPWASSVDSVNNILSIFYFVIPMPLSFTSNTMLPPSLYADTWIVPVFALDSSMPSQRAFSTMGCRINLGHLYLVNSRGILTMNLPLWISRVYCYLNLDYL